MPTLGELTAHFQSLGVTLRGAPQGNAVRWTLAEPPYAPQSAGAVALIVQSFPPERWEACVRAVQAVAAGGAVPIVRGPAPDTALSADQNVPLETLVTGLSSFFDRRAERILEDLTSGAPLEALVQSLARGLGHAAWIPRGGLAPVLAARSSQFISQIRSLPLHELLGIYPHRAVTSGGEAAGWLLVYPTGGEPIDRPLDEAAAALTLYFDRTGQKLASAERLNEEIWRSLLTAHPAELEALVRRAERFLPREELAVALVIPQTSPAQTRDRLRAACKAHICAPFGSGFAAPACRDDLPALRGLAAAVPDASLALGGFKQSPKDAGESLNEALAAADAGLRRPGTLACWDDLDDAALLTPVARSDAGRRYVTRRLAPFAFHPELIETLEALSLENWNGAAAADRLRIHYNTVRQRLGKIERLSPGAASGRNGFALSLALRLRRLAL